MADGLSAILRNRVQNGVIAPVKICRRAPGTSHLLFADDTMLFFVTLSGGKAPRRNFCISNERKSVYKYTYRGESISGIDGRVPF